MSQALAVAIAQDVTDLLQAGVTAGDFDRPFRPERRYFPVVSLKSGDPDDVLVLVTPARERRVERDSLATWGELHKLAIGVLKKCPDKENATVDPLMRLAEQITNYSELEKFAVTGGGTAHLIAREQEMVYDAEWLEEEAVFFSLIELTYSVVASFSNEL